METEQKREAAKTLLLRHLKMPNGVASRQVEALTEDELDAVLAVDDEVLQVRRQIIKAVLTDAAARIASEQSEAAPKSEEDPAEDPPSPEEPSE